ncbi:MAG: hypothetical protein HYV27_11715 [Candidatus Hydrogenedentes bacterium]|nr:hypothetical protein [Candidatus Hydrogenedentota bacterium]
MKLYSVVLSLLLLAAGQASGQTTLSLGDAVPLLNSDFYTGVDQNGSGPSPSGRLTFFGQPSKDGTQVAFWAAAGNFSSIAIFGVTIGEPDSWFRISPDIAASPSTPIAWSPDDSHVFTTDRRFDVATGTEEIPFGYTLQHPVNGAEFYPIDDTSTTSTASGNWLATLANPLVPAGGGYEQVLLVPVHPDGSLDTGRDPVFVTNFSDGLEFDWPHISVDGSLVAGAYFQGGGVSGVNADVSDIYLVKNVQQIVAAPKIAGTMISSLAPTSAADSNVVAIRTNEDAVDNFAHVPVFSQAKDLVFYCEDWNNIWTDDDFFGTLNLSDFDIMASNTDGTGADIRFPNAGNQFVTGLTLGGLRVLYLNGPGANIQLYMSTIETATSVEDVSDPLPENTTEVDLGEGPVPLPFVLTDSAVQLTTEAEVADASGTTIVLPPNQVINFPEGSGASSITIETPISPVTEAQLPPNPFVNAIPIVREFTPSGTQFFPPISITIAYTDAEVDGIDEANLAPYLFNDMTGIFDIPVAPEDIIDRDVVNNTITFRVSHFSVYGLGGTLESAVPASSNTGLIALTALLLLTGAAVATRRAMQR